MIIGIAHAESFVYPLKELDRSDTIALLILLPCLAKKEPTIERIITYVMTSENNSSEMPVPIPSATASSTTENSPLGVVYAPTLNPASSELCSLFPISAPLTNFPKMERITSARSARTKSADGKANLNGNIIPKEKKKMVRNKFLNETVAPKSFRKDLTPESAEPRKNATITSETLSTSILYGGSCKPSNAEELFNGADVDGGLIGGASLKSRDFVDITKSY